MPYRLRHMRTDEVLKEWRSIPKKVIFPNGDQVHLITDGHVNDNVVFESYTPPPPPPRVISSGEIKNECGRRIFVEIDDSAQRNLSAMRAAERFNADQIAAYDDGLDWIMAMRTKCAELIASKEETYRDDKHWPAIPANAKALADQF